MENEDVFGGQVNLAARVMAHASDGGIRLSDEAKQAVMTFASPAHANLRWTEFSGVELKGLTDPVTLWALSRDAD